MQIATQLSLNIYCRHCIHVLKTHEKHNNAITIAIMFAS